MNVGDQVGWQWGSGLATGTVLDIRKERTQIQTKGKTITRNGQNDDPAIIIKSVNGSQVIKLQHEIQVIKEADNV